MGRAVAVRGRPRRPARRGRERVDLQREVAAGGVRRAVVETWEGDRRPAKRILFFIKQYTFKRAEYAKKV